MKLRATLAAGIAAAAAAAATLVPIATTAASAAPAVPFTDPSANGAIGFCSQDNKPVTSGSLLTEPFVWKAVSTVPAPSGYTLASLQLFQPIQHEDPSAWTGYALTGDTKFDNSAHPAAQAITIDPPLLEPDHAYPPYWDGYYQLRMFFSSPDKSPVTSPYPAAIIQVKGQKWTLISGGKVDCAASSAVSKLTSELPKSVVDTPQTIVVGGKKSAGSTPSTGAKSGAAGSTASTQAGSSGSQPPKAGGEPGSITTGQSTQLAAGPGTSGGGGGGSAWWIAVVVAVVVVLGGAGVTIGLRRRQRSA